ncbi:MAG: protein-L-isoaspartate(D-aspartate) O-methyltransferase [Candidatus Woesearchaeota archaeon]
MQKPTLLKYWEKNKLITDKEVLKAFKKVKREDFVLKQYKNQAYEDIPLPIGFNATISQPTTVMIMTQALQVKKGNKILEIGTGSGYQSALLSILVGPKGKVITTEIVPELTEFSKQNLEQYKNIEVVQTDGSKGYEKEKSYDRIIYTAAVPKVENFILEQLKDPGIYLAPIGDEYSQELIKVTKKDLKIEKESLGYFQFVPLKGKFGFK